MLTMRAQAGRVDAGGNLIYDEAVFECTGNFPFAHLFSVIPRGDGRTKKSQMMKGPLEE